MENWGVDKSVSGVLLLEIEWLFFEFWNHAQIKSLTFWTHALISICSKVVRSRRLPLGQNLFAVSTWCSLSCFLFKINLAQIATINSHFPTWNSLIMSVVFDSTLNFITIFHELLEILIRGQVLAALIYRLKPFFLKNAFGSRRPVISLDPWFGLHHPVIWVLMTTFGPLFYFIFLNYSI